MRAAAGRARWSFGVPDTAATGPAKLIVACGSTGRLTGTLPVVPGKRTLGITVLDRGFSQRYRTIGSRVSYGVALKNTTADRDALNVTVLVNFVDAADTLIATDTTHLTGIRANALFYVGGTANMSSTEVEKLEVSVQVGSRAAPTIHEPPVGDVRVLGTSDGYVGAVAGQIENDRDNFLLRTAHISAVLFDREGRVVGGATGIVLAPLKTGVRAYFEANAGSDSTPMANVELAKVSVQPRFTATG